MPISRIVFIAACVLISAQFAFAPVAEATELPADEPFCYRNPVDSSLKYCPVPLRMLREQADTGSVAALTMLGEVALSRHMEPEALHWLRKAAESGYAPAQYLYAVYSGKNGKEQAAEALEWLRKAAAQGNVSAQTDFPLMDEMLNGQADPKSAELWLGRALDNGDLRALSMLRALAGKEHIQAHFAETAKRLKYDSERGDAFASWYLGLLYEAGMGVVSDGASSRQYYLKAAEAGHPVARYRLAEMLGKAGDTEQFLHWMTVAAEQGYGPAQLALADFLAERGNMPEEFQRTAGWNTTEAFQRAAGWYTKAAVGGERQAPLKLARMYLDGRLPHNPAEALLWYTMAANYGLPEGFAGLAHMYEEGIGTQKNAELADFWRSVSSRCDRPFSAEEEALVRH